MKDTNEDVVNRGLETVSPLLRRLAYGSDLSSEEAREALNVIGQFDAITDPVQSDGLFMLALTFGLMAKGPTAGELHGFVQSIIDHSPNFPPFVEPDTVIDVSGTGADRLKTFNVGTAACFVIAAGGLRVAKQATRGYTGFTGSADIFQALGVDPFRVTAEEIGRYLRDVGLAAFHTPSLGTGFRNRVDFLSKLKAIGLSYPTPWHLVSWAYSPVRMTSRLYGVFAEDYLHVMAELFGQLGYSRAMVVYGRDGLDELSNIGETAIVELNDGRTRRYTLTPEDVGLRRAHREEIETLNLEDRKRLDDPGVSAEEREQLLQRGRDANLDMLLRVLAGEQAGHEADARTDLVAMTAGAAFYLCDQSEDLKDGVMEARKLIISGRAWKKLEEFVKYGGDGSRLRELKKRL